jgi:hypothetical protein
MADGTTAIDTALTTTGDADGSDLIEYLVGDGEHVAEGPLQYIATHDEIASRKLAPPFWGKPFIQAVLSAFVREIQTLEDTLWEMMELRTLPLADLPRLKVLGRIVGQPRFGLDTEDYRTLIEARALANVSRGRASDVFAVLNVILGEGTWSLFEVGNATLHLTTSDVIDAEHVKMLELVLPDVRAAGVGFQLLFATDDDVFLWGDTWGAPEEWGSVRVL